MRLLRSAGRPVPGVVLQIQDAEGNPLPKGESGEVCARAGNFMREYWNRPEPTAEVFRDGWYHTGDAGYLDEDGYLFLVDRVKDMIVTGGENVYSTEVENALASHPAVLPVPSPITIARVAPGWSSAPRSPDITWVAASCREALAVTLSACRRCRR